MKKNGEMRQETEKKWGDKTRVKTNGEMRRKPERKREDKPQDERKWGEETQDGKKWFGSLVPGVWFPGSRGPVPGGRFPGASSRGVPGGRFPGSRGAGSLVP